MSTTYVLYTPAQERDGAQFGVVVRIKTGTLTSAYIGFASEALAKEFCERSHTGPPTIIVESKRINSELPSAVEEKFVLRFPNAETLHAYFTDRDSFPYNQFLVPVEGERAA
jgi:hypothetical protein